MSVSDNDDPPRMLEVSITEGGTASFTFTANPVPASFITVQVGVTQDGDFGGSRAVTITMSGATATYTTTDDANDESDIKGRVYPFP